jgi:hypothetical protein
MQYPGRSSARRLKSAGNAAALPLGLTAPAQLSAEPAATGAGFPPQADRRPGWPFSIRQEAGIFWLTRADGQQFFSFGVNGVNRGEPNDPPEIAAYRAENLHSSDSDWAVVTAGRVSAWGFTTIGGWSDWNLLSGVPGASLINTPVLHIGHSAGAPWRDLWNPNWGSVMKKQARVQMRASGDGTMGFYPDNELGWWAGALFRETLDHPAGSGQRQRLVALLRERYQGDWGNLLADFEPEGAGSFEELGQAGQVYLRPGSSGIATYRRFLEIIARRYYRLTSMIVRELSPGSLLLGDRYRTSYYPELVLAAAGELDVISTNLKASWNDGSFARFYLDTIHRLSGKPVIVSEIYLAAMENSSGNRNSTGGFPTVDTQAQRAAAVQRSLTQLAGLPYVVGVDWFQYSDESPDGRYDGEDFNMGLVDIHGEPYSKLIERLAEMDFALLHGAGRTPRGNARDGVPVAPADPSARWEPREALRNWDRERGFVPSLSEAPFADLYLAWNSEELWLGLYAMDMTENNFYRDRELPEEDRMHWQVKLKGARAKYSFRLGHGGYGTHSTVQEIDEATFHSLAYDTRAVAALRVKASELGKESFEQGDVIELDVVLDSHARADRTNWRGRFTLD